jgi:protoporphyrinogen oxidase
MTKKAIIIGAGPAGLTAAYELLKRTDIVPIVLEKSEYIGGISRTIDYKGNRMDMGPHRFFSKSDRVMDWWLKIMPLDEQAKDSPTIHYQNKSRRLEISGNGTAADKDKKMLLIPRLTRIYFLRKFFTYPIQLSLDTLKILGLKRTIDIMASYLWIRLFPRKEEKTLEDFIINKFGKQLYLLFFKDYTEKVWGVSCEKIPAEWGAQRIKGVSLSKAIRQAIKPLRKKKGTDIGQKATETSLIEQFLYPKYGPGSLWEEVARQVEELGGKIYLNEDVQKIEIKDKSISAVYTINSLTGNSSAWEGNYFFSTMPVQELIADMGDEAPKEVQSIAAGLQYRDFINVGVLLKQFSVPGKEPGKYEKIELKDNWIYIQERDVKVGRLMIYNNWGGGMVKDPNTTWIGMEYFCNKTDDFWALDDNEIQRFALMELEKMQLIRLSDVLETTILRMEKTYPAYFGAYVYFDKIRAFTDLFPELFLIGRNGMHKYNNADHSMLTAMVAVDNIVAGIQSKENIWTINTEQEYHEEKKETQLLPRHTSLPANKQEPMTAFYAYVWKNRRNRIYCMLALLVYLLQFVFFKVQFPFANYMPDSYFYLEAAASNSDVNMWPVAYSKFLRLVSAFTHSDTILVGLQYFFMQMAGLLFLFTLAYFLRPGRVVRNSLYIFFLLNPIALYVANYICADALFIGCSLLWFTSLTWIIFRPQPWMGAVHALLLLGCFTLRYNAIYYPLISALAFFLSPQPWLNRLIAIGLAATLLFGSISYTSNKMKEVTGHLQFSAFGGWQLANNALYMYEHIPASKRQPPPARFNNLETMVRQHIDSLKKVKLAHDDSTYASFYLWSASGPLIQYMKRQYKKDSITPYFKRWASQGPLFFGYGRYLIANYPESFVTNFILPNAIKFAVPPSEFLNTYNLGGDSVLMAAKDWFQYRSLKVRNRNTKNAILSFADWYSVFTALINLLLLIHIIGILLFKVLNKQPQLVVKWIFIVLSLWALNAAFSIAASSIVLRYQIFPILVGCCVALVSGEWIYKQQPKISSK